jgi:hypothetical protein
MIASFSASNQVGELKKRGEKELQEEKNIELPEKPEAQKHRNRRIEYLIHKKKRLNCLFSLVNQFFINGIALFNIKGAAVETIAPYGITELYVLLSHLQYFEA